MIIEWKDAIRLSTRAMPSLAGDDRDGEATARATWSPERVGG
jgi:hypothetical protein